MRRALSFVVLTACAKAPETTAAAPEPAAPAVVAADDAGAASPPADAAPSTWTDAAKCTFPPVSPPEGTTAKQCCAPAPDVTVCLETMSTLHYHEVGFYTLRWLTITAGAADPLVLPLDRHHHGSMKHRDTASVVLRFRIHEGGLDLTLAGDAGCKAACIAAGTCTGEVKRVGAICESAGHYGWDGQGLVKAAR